MNAQGGKNQGFGQNKVNTFYSKAKDDLMREEIQEKLTYQNKLEFEVSKRTRETTVDKSWRQKAARVKMMNDLLKNKLVDFTTDIANITNVGYNFKDRTITKPDWLQEKQQNSSNLQSSQLIVFQAPNRKKINETFDPIPTPNHELVDEYEKMRENLKSAIKSKSIKAIEQLVEQAIDKYPLELEQLICHGELVIKQYNERMLESSLIISHTSSQVFETEEVIKKK
eukprot:403366113